MNMAGRTTAERLVTAVRAVHEMLDSEYTSDARSQRLLKASALTLDELAIWLLTPEEYLELCHEVSPKPGGGGADERAE